MKLALEMASLIEQSETKRKGKTVKRIEDNYRDKEYNSLYREFLIISFDIISLFNCINFFCGVTQDNDVL